MELFILQMKPISLFLRGLDNCKFKNTEILSWQADGLVADTKPAKYTFDFNPF